MKKQNFYNSDLMKIVCLDKYVPARLTLKDFDIDMNYGFSFYEKLEKDIAGLFANLPEGIDIPVLIELQGSFKKLKKSKFSDYKTLLQLIESLCTSECTTNEPLEREARLAIPSHLSKIKASFPVVKKLVNNKMRYPILGIVILDEDCKIIESVF